MIRLIIDCDPGNGVAGANVDDGLALALALSSPEITLEMVTTVAGNTPCQVGAHVAQKLLQTMHCSAPVYQGASQALVEPAAPWRDLLDNGARDKGLLHLWQNLPQQRDLPEQSPIAAYELGRRVCESPGEITVIAIGPLTNIAHAIQLFPSFSHAVKSLVIMGGVFNVTGYRKDTNFGIDPEAAHVVLTSGANITLVPMDTTVQTMFRHQDLDNIAAIDSPLCRFLVKTMRPWLDYSIQTRGLPGCWIHDVVTVAHLLAPELSTYQYYYLDVVLEGALSRGMTLQQPLSGLKLHIGAPKPQGKAIKVLESIDNQALIDLIISRLKR